MLRNQPAVVHVEFDEVDQQQQPSTIWGLCANSASKNMVWFPCSKSGCLHDSLTLTPAGPLGCQVAFLRRASNIDIKRVFHPISISSPRDFNASWNEQVLGLSLEWRLLGFITDHYDRGHWLFTRRTAGNQRNHWRRNSLPPRSTRTSPSNLFPVIQPLFGPRMVV